MNLKVYEYSDVESLHTITNILLSSNIFVSLHELSNLLESFSSYHGISATVFLQTAREGCDGND